MGVDIDYEPEAEFSYSLPQSYILPPNKKPTWNLWTALKNYFTSDDIDK